MLPGSSVRTCSLMTTPASVWTPVRTAAVALADATTVAGSFQAGVSASGDETSLELRQRGEDVEH